MKTLALLFLLTAMPAAAADFTGTWKVDGTVEDNPVTPTCKLKQTGTTITGTCAFDADHVDDVTGEVKGAEVIWKFKQEYQGTVYTLTFDGKPESDASLKGTIAVDPADADGDFTAKKL